tara:strand:+ start:457 stop:639 length:183 start_codon:yes stop_codon:yes gene_type:complete
VDYLIDPHKDKIVKVLITDLEAQFVLDLQIEQVGQIDLEFLSGQLGDQTVLIIVQVFHLA